MLANAILISLTAATATFGTPTDSIAWLPSDEVSGEISPKAFGLQAECSPQIVQNRSLRFVSTTAPSEEVDTSSQASKIHQDDLSDTSIDDRPISATDASPHALAQSSMSWVPTPKLREELETLSNLAQEKLTSPFELMVSSPINPTPAVEIVEWVAAIERNLDKLQSLPELGANEAEGILDSMKALANRGTIRAESISVSNHRKDWLCAAYSVTRRVDVWKAAWHACRSSNTSIPASSNGFSPESQTLSAVITAIRSDLELTRDAKAWSKFLLLDDVEQLATRASELQHKQEAKQLAQRILGRLDGKQLTDVQANWLSRPSIDDLRITMQQWASTPVNYEVVLRQIEQIELDAVDQVSKQLAEASQNLRFSGKENDRDLATQLDLHYRNANIRVAIQGDFINRFLPQNEPMTVPIRTRAMGTNIYGRSQVESELEVSLAPSTDRWNLVLQSIGNITTLSTGQQSVVEIHTSGQAKFQSGTSVTVDRSGVTFDKTNVDVSGRIRLRKIETELDEYPILGSFVRTIAERRYVAMAPQANRISNRTAQQQIRAEISDTLDQQTKLANEKLGSLVINPLTRMELAPSVTEMRTTDELLLGRFRVAGEWQMGAFTPRPRAPSESLISTQIHQSAINNTLEKLLPSGEAIPLEEVLRQINASFGKESWEKPQDMPEGVEIRFSSSRPVSIEIEDGGVMLTLRIVQMKRGRAIDLRNVIIKAAYRPQTDGLHAYLVRDGHLSISGPNMSMRKRLPARTIFNKVLSTNHMLPITPKTLQDREAFQGLAISQLELERGWIGLALSDAKPGTIALRQ